MSSQPEYVLEMRGITKRFPGVVAVDAVDLSVNPGEILALVGENGAGKSTLMKILSGAYQADGGLVVIDGVEHRCYGPREAIKYGVGIIYQELNYWNELSIAENIFVGRLPVKKISRRIDYRKLGKDCRHMLDLIGLDHDPFSPMSTLAVAEKQLIEISRAFSKSAKILVFDEPTSALNEQETERLFKLIRNLSEQGKSVIYISHKMSEVFAISDRIQVIRDGKSVAVLETSRTSRQDVVKHMVGRELAEMYPIAGKETGETLLETVNLTAGKAIDINIKLRKGEIVGLFGLMGAGTAEIAEAIYGRLKHRSGEIKIKGKPCRIESPEDAIKNGIAFVPAERKTEGLILHHSIKNNITLTFLKRLSNGVTLNLKYERQVATDWIRRLNIKTASMHQDVAELSGGNQQKVVLARCLVAEPEIVIMNEPTKGVDVGAKVDVYQIIEGLCRKGIGVLVIFSEMAELMAIADRILVVCNGRITGELSRQNFSQERIMHYAIPLS